MSAEKITGIFYLAQAEVLDAEKMQPGDYLVHTNDIQEVLNRTERRILIALGIEAPDE